MHNKYFIYCFYSSLIFFIFLYLLLIFYQDTVVPRFPEHFSPAMYKKVSGFPLLFIVMRPV